MQQVSSIVILLIVFISAIATANNKINHFGFNFLSSYNDCIEIIDRDYGSVYKTSTEQQPFSKVAIPTIRFWADFNGDMSMNTLEFTPLTKRLYSVSHFIIPGGDKVNFYKTMARVFHALNNKYGKPKKEKYDPKFDQLPEVKQLKKNMIMHDWITAGVNVHLSVLKDLSDTPDSLTISYTSITANELKEKEQRNIEKHLDKDL